MTDDQVRAVEREARHLAEEPDNIEELVQLLRQVRDKAHWLNVHRRMGLAKHIEQGADLLLRITWDLQGRRARGEKL